MNVCSPRIPTRTSTRTPVRTPVRTFPITILLAFLLAGCSSTTPKLDMNKVAQAFYGQERSVESLKVTGLTTLTMTGTNMTVILRNTLTPLSIIPDDTASTGIIVSAVKDTILTGAGIYAAKSVMTTLAQKPNTISPEIVRPEVITVTGN